MAESAEFVKLAPAISRALKKPGQISKIQTFVKNRISLNSDILAKPYLGVPNALITVKDQDEFFELCGIDKEMIDVAITNTTEKNVKAGIKMYKAPMYLGCTMVIRQLLIMKDMKTANLISVFFFVWLYEKMINKYFENGIKEEVIIYTVNNISDKFLLRKLGSVFKLLIYCSDAMLKKNGNALMKTKDSDIWLYPSASRNKLNLSIQNLAHVYYKNFEEGNFLNAVSSDAVDEEGEEYTKDIETASGKIQKAATKFEMFFIRNDVDPVLCKITASMIIGISDKSVAGMMERIKANNTQDAKDFIVCCLDYFSRNLKDFELRFIKAKGFGILVSKTLVKKTNKDIVFKKLFDSIGRMARASSETYRSSSRAATKLNIERAIAVYLALTLQKAY